MRKVAFINLLLRLEILLSSFKLLILPMWEIFSVFW